MQDYDYEKLLDRAWEHLPPKLRDHSRFEIPKADSFVDGNQTVVKNFSQIADLLGRDPKHLQTYLSRELASMIIPDGSRIIINRVLKRELINKRIEDYAREYVLCHQCGRPDTKFTELEGGRIIKCEACGGWRPLRRIK